MANISILRLSWLYLLYVMCIVNLTHQSSPSDMEERFQRLEGLLLSKLSDIEYKISKIDSVVQQIDPNVVNVIKLKVDKIEAEMAAYGPKSSQDTTMCDTPETKDQGSSIVGDIQFVKQGISLVGAKLDLLTISNNAMSVKIDTLDRQLKQENRQTQETTNIHEIHAVEKENNLCEAAIQNLTLSKREMGTELKMMKTQINDSLIQILSQKSVILNEIKDIKEQGDSIMYSMDIISLTSDEIYNQMDGLVNNKFNNTGMEIRNVAQDGCLPPFKKLPETNECFYPSYEQLSWDDARSRCQILDADLAIPKDFEALHKLLSSMPKRDTYHYFYVGGNDRASPGTKHSWINGEPVTGVPWELSEPGFTSDDNCLIVDQHNGKLFDNILGCISTSDLSDNIGFICQKDFIN